MNVQDSACAKQEKHVLTIIKNKKKKHILVVYEMEQSEIKNSRLITTIRC